MAAPLQMVGLSAGYGEPEVVAQLSLHIQAGEAWVVLGPNGAGKSTLVRAVMGLLQPSKGSVHVCGLPLATTSARDLARVVSWVPQTLDEHTAFTGLELALMGRAPHLSGWGAASAREIQLALDTMKELGVEHLASRPLSQVSGGERRRVWLARALVQNPRLLVLDEPTAFLDIRHQVETLRAVKRRVADGLGVLAVLHDVNLAVHLATHVVLLKEGKSIAQGPVAEVLSAEKLSVLYDIEMHAAFEQERVYVPQWEKL